MQKNATIREAWERKYPEQVVLAITKNAAGRVNLMAIGWVCIASNDPPMFLVGIDDHAYTLELIRASGEFVIAYPSSAMAKETLYAGTTHGHHEDKGAKSGLKFIPGEKGNVPLLADAVANFECRFVTEYRPGNCPLIVGEVVASHVNADESVKRLVTLGKGYQLGACDLHGSATPHIAKWRESLCRIGFLSSIIMLFFVPFMVGYLSVWVIVASSPLLLPLLFGTKKTRFIALGLLLILNIFAFGLMRVEKERHARARRIIEKTLSQNDDGVGEGIAAHVNADESVKHLVNLEK